LKWLTNKQCLASPALGSYIFIQYLHWSLEILPVREGATISPYFLLVTSIRSTCSISFKKVKSRSCSSPLLIINGTSKEIPLKEIKTGFLNWASHSLKSLRVWSSFSPPKMNTPDEIMLPIQVIEALRGVSPVVSMSK